MNDDNNQRLLATVTELRDLVRLIAEPQIAARDQRLRAELRRIVGRSIPKQKSILLMDGTRSQKQIREKTGMNQGNLSTLVKQLGKAELLAAGSQEPRLAILVPSNFFELREEAGVVQ